MKKRMRVEGGLRWQGKKLTWEKGVGREWRDGGRRGKKKCKQRGGRQGGQGEWRETGGGRGGRKLQGEERQGGRRGQKLQGEEREGGRRGQKLQGEERRGKGEEEAKSCKERRETWEGGRGEKKKLLVNRPNLPDFAEGGTTHSIVVRSYLGYYTGSHQNSAVKRPWARIVLGWVTSREVLVLHPPSFSSFSPPLVCMENKTQGGRREWNGRKENAEDGKGVLDLLCCGGRHNEKHAWNEGPSMKARDKMREQKEALQTFTQLLSLFGTGPTTLRDLPT